MDFRKQKLLLPAIPELLDNILIMMFNLGPIQLDKICGPVGKKVEYKKSLGTVPFRKMFFSEKKIISPCSGIILNISNNRDLDGWCQILPFKGSKIEFDGNRIFREFTQGFYPMKKSVYRYARRSLYFKEEDIKKSVRELLNSECITVDLTEEDFESIKYLAEMRTEYNYGLNKLLENLT